MLLIALDIQLFNLECRFNLEIEHSPHGTKLRLLKAFSSLEEKRSIFPVSSWPINCLLSHLLSFSYCWLRTTIICFPAKPAPCCVHSSLPSSPIPPPPSCSCGTQTLTLPRGALNSLKVPERQSVNNLFVVLVEYQLGIEKKRKFLESSWWDNQQQTWTASLHCVANANMRAKFRTVLK